MIIACRGNVELENLTTQADLAFSWLFEEYCFYQGFNRTFSLIITDEATSLLKEFCQVIIVIWKSFFTNSLFAQGETGALAGVNLVRETYLGTVLSLYDRRELTNIIEEYCVMYLRFPS